MDIRGFEVVSQFEDKDIALPRRKTTESAGYDIECAEAVTIAPGEMKLVATGLKAFMNYDEYWRFIFVPAWLLNGTLCS